MGYGEEDFQKIVCKEDVKDIVAFIVAEIKGEIKKDILNKVRNTIMGEVKQSVTDQVERVFEIRIDKKRRIFKIKQRVYPMDLT